MFLSRFPSLVFAALILASPVSAKQEIPNELKGIGIGGQLGNQVPLDSLTFLDESGTPRSLGYFFQSGRPVVLMMAYYECPNLCTLLMNGFVKSATNFDWSIGEHFDVVTVSIDPSEGPDLAAKKKRAYIRSLGKPDVAPNWHFLTGTQENITKLTESIGFRYRYDELQEEYAHSSALIILTPDGRVSRYLYGIQFPQKDLKLALLEASDGKIGKFIDQVLLFCYTYDPTLRSYSFTLTKIMRGLGILTVATLGLWLFIFWRRQIRLKPKASGAASAQGEPPVRESPSPKSL